MKVTKLHALVGLIVLAFAAPAPAQTAAPAQGGTMPGMAMPPGGTMPGMAIPPGGAMPGNQMQAMMMRCTQVRAEVQRGAAMTDYRRSMMRQCDKMDGGKPGSPPPP